MLFENLSAIVAHERNHLHFIRSREDWNIVVAIGRAAEQGKSIGFKGLTLHKVASPSTLTRNLKRLIADDVIRRVAQPHDGRMVAYMLTKPALDAFRRHERFLRNIKW